MKYPPSFYINRNKSMRSSEIIVRIIDDLIKPKKIIDVGCGDGCFLKTFSEIGADKILGVEGNWINKNQLKIPKSNIIIQDLNVFSPPKESFDLAICLEVAEHLKRESAKAFVHGLTECADIVLFSAAIPLQGGTNHVNEQWQDYWVNLFKNEGYVALDFLRNKLWNNKDVAYWFAQNIFLFVKEKSLNDNVRLRELYASRESLPCNIVHPTLFTMKAGRPYGYIETTKYRFKKLMLKFKKK